MVPHYQMFTCLCLAYRRFNRNGKWQALRNFNSDISPYAIGVRAGTNYNTSTKRAFQQKLKSPH